MSEAEYGIIILEQKPGGSALITSVMDMADALKSEGHGLEEIKDRIANRVDMVIEYWNECGGSRG